MIMFPLAKHPLYRKLKEQLTKLRAADGRLPSVDDLKTADFHTTERLHDRKLR